MLCSFCDPVNFPLLAFFCFHKDFIAALKGFFWWMLLILIITHLETLLSTETGTVGTLAWRPQVPLGQGRECAWRLMCRDLTVLTLTARWVAPWILAQGGWVLKRDWVQAHIQTSEPPSPWPLLGFQKAGGQAVLLTTHLSRRMGVSLRDLPMLQLWTCHCISLWCSPPVSNSICAHRLPSLPLKGVPTK